MTAADRLSPLPGRTGLFIGIRESLAYLRDPDRFIAERTERYGPVFGTTLFFRPTAVVGGIQAVENFLEQERPSPKAHCRQPSQPCTPPTAPSTRTVRGIAPPAPAMPRCSPAAPSQAFCP